MAAPFHFLRIFQSFYWFVILLFLLPALHGAAPDSFRYTARNWRQGQGLPGNEITHLTLDRDGYLWIATTRGLARFDGSRFLSFGQAEGRFETTPGYTALLADRDGSLLLGVATGGLFRFENGIFSTVELPGSLAGKTITALHRAADSALWIGFSGGTALRQFQGRDEIFALAKSRAPDCPTQIATNGTGNVWLTNGTVLVHFENGALIATPVRDERERLFIASAREDGPWVFSDERLFKILDNAAVELTKVNGYTSAYQLQSVIEDANGDLWLASRFRGLRRVLLADNFRQQTVVDNPGDISTVIQDAAGHIWAGSKGGGLIRAKPATVRIYNRSLRLVENHSLSVCEDASGTMWFANRDGGVFHMHISGRVTQMERPPGYYNFSAFSVTPAMPDGVWASSSHGLLRADRTHLHPLSDPAPIPADFIVKVSFTAKDGSLWLAAGAGRLVRYKDNAWTTFDSTSGLEPVEIRSIAEDQSGRIWLGCAQAAVFRLENGRFTRVPVVTPRPAGAIQAIHFDIAGHCWFGSERAGLLHLRDNVTTIIDNRDGLPSNSITQIVADEHDSIWFGSPDSIFRLRRSALIDFVGGKTSQLYPSLLGADDGVGETTCLGNYQPSVWKSTDGRLWFATREGVVAIDPSRELHSLPPPVIQIYSVQLDGIAAAPAQRVVVESSTRELKFKYSVLCLATPDRARTRYRLHGYDDDWTPALGSETAKYPRLPPGRYRFEVTALIAGQDTGQVSETILVDVRASWWQTLWFRLLVAAAGIAAIGIAVRVWSHKRLRARLARLEHQSALEQERARIAQNIHDDLGAGLTRISLLTQSSQDGGDTAKMDRIYDTVRELTRSMDEVVWAVNPRHDKLESLASYLTDFAQSFLSDAGIRCRVRLPELLPQQNVPAQHRHHLFLAFKEALHNVVKHAHATEVVVQLQTAGDQLHLVVADNGSGLPETKTADDAPAFGSRNGLANMKSRMAAIGGAFEISSPPHGGTTASFRVPLAP